MYKKKKNKSLCNVKIDERALDERARERASDEIFFFVYIKDFY